MNTCAKNIKDTTNIHSILLKIYAIMVALLLSIKLKYFPLEEHEIEYTFNDTMRHCPKNDNDVAKVNKTIQDMFGEINDTDLYRAMMSEIEYAMMPSCKDWQTGNIMTLPRVMESPFSNVITECADRMSTTYWVLWYADNVVVMQPHQNRGVFRTHRETIVINDKPDCIPEGVIAAAQVTLGVIQTNDNILKGFQWKLYR